MYCTNMYKYGKIRARYSELFEGGQVQAKRFGENVRCPESPVGLVGDLLNRNAHHQTTADSPFLGRDSITILFASYMYTYMYIYIHIIIYIHVCIYIYIHI